MKTSPLLFLGIAVLTATQVMAQPVTQPFTFNLRTQTLPAVRNGAVAWADIDNDGDLDALVSGRGQSGLTGGIYRNEGASDGSVSFSPVPGAVRGLAYGRAAFADMDGDGDLDLAVSGSEVVQAPYAPVVLIYRNDGSGFTAMDHGGAVPALHSGGLAWGDADNDGDLDLLVSGVDETGAFQTAIAASNGDGSFTQVDPGLPGFAYGDAKWGDYDADGDADLLMSGATDQGFQTRIYRNDGGTFAAIATPFAPVAFSSVDWGDFDADGDLDIAIAGGRVTPRILEGETRIYQNNAGSFTEVAAGVGGVLAGSVTWGDYDNDGDLDLMTLGAESALGRRTARVYRNNGSGEFENATFLVGAIFAAADWGDFDGDGDLDLLTAGATSYGEDVVNLYENNRQVRPDRPTAPTALRAQKQDATIHLEWTDGQTGVITYDLRIGTYPGAADVRGTPSDPSTGVRRLGRPGFHASASTYVHNLEPGTYYWSVQAIGPSFQASQFAEESSFTVSATATGVDDRLLPTEFALRPAYPNPFAGATRLEYDLPEAADVSVSVYDLLGRRTAVLVNEMLQAGTHSAAWQVPTGIAGGVYFVEMRAGGYRTTRTVTLVR